MHPAELSTEKLLEQCDVRRLRRSGPGGQHRNKVETAVALHHLSTDVKAEASERRSQAENRKMALFRLRVNLALEVRTERTAGESPSSLWKSRVAAGRVAVSETHDDFPVLLAEALDAIAAADADVKTAAERLGCSASQLVKFLKKDARGLTAVNRWREERGLNRLR